VRFCYDSIIQGKDPRGYLWMCADWNAFKIHPAAALNISRALLLTAILEAVAGKQNRVNEAVKCVFDVARSGFSRMVMEGGCEASAVEVEALGRVVGITIRLLPHLGREFAGLAVPLHGIAEVEPPSIFSSCLTRVIQRLPSTPQ